MTDLEQRVNDVLTKLDIEIAEMRAARERHEVYMYKAGEDAKTRQFLESLNRDARNFYISYTIFVTLAIIAIFLK